MRRHTGAPAPTTPSPDAFGKDGKDGELAHDAYTRNAYHGDEYDTASEYSDKQVGVRRIEAVSKSWTKTSLIIAYVTYVSLVACWRLWN
jgi:hypothetical protein